MEKTVFITGASSGIGREAVKYFIEKEWQVIAAMRRPELETELKNHKKLLLVSCDVTNHESIEDALQRGIEQFKQIDVLVNNAGYYLFGPLEEASDEQVRQQIDTNLIGVISMTKALIPYFRGQQSGRIINISSIAGRTSLPLQSVYHATKWGIEGLTESLRYELRPFNIKLKLIEPGVIHTDFYERSMQTTALSDEYELYGKTVRDNVAANGANGSSPRGVAEVIFKAATDNSSKLRYTVGKSRQLIQLRQLLPLASYQFLVGKVMTQKN
ncbi:SDR family oxidoreductase [Enterococcus sp. BWM-S5]|uniref:SDR family oxidoreductase n=1 Tax=Enterococcus larvae TaxID=2794352 RepID=A0ABS4CP60_9ENTE|nr:SDR family oxidoreductase [Enterococcus larvae]MBP1048230.1 SDR family oxidoreductase [Enterococcus larvae]